MPGLPTPSERTMAVSRFMIAVAALCLMIGSVRADDEPKAAPPDVVPPGTIIEPEPQKPGMNDEDDEDEGPDGPGCPVNQRPLELLV